MSTSAEGTFPLIKSNDNEVTVRVHQIMHADNYVDHYRVIWTNLQRKKRGPTEHEIENELKTTKKMLEDTSKEAKKAETSIGKAAQEGRELEVSTHSSSCVQRTISL